MNCHIAPQVYLREWTIPNTQNGIYVFNKQFIHKKGEHKNIENMRDTSFAQEDLYVLDTDKETSKYALRDVSELTEKLSLAIERSLFAYDVEPKWKCFLDYVNKELINKKVVMCFAKHKADLITFFTIQFFRRFKNLEYLALNQIYEVLDDMCDEKPTVEDKDMITETMSINALLKQFNGEKNFIGTMINQFSNESQISFLFAHKNSYFITSDNPCFYEKTEDAYGGIYMPVNKRLCLYVNKPNILGIDKYALIDMSLINTAFINNLILKNSIESVAFDSEKISDLFSKDFNFDEWKKSFYNAF